MQPLSRSFAIAATVAAPGQSHAKPAKARVLICDDSSAIRLALSRILESDTRIAIAGKVAGGAEAVDFVKRAKVDVVLLDIEMPAMDGLAALPLLLRADPGLRVLMASSLTTRGADIALQALRLGAADYIAKPGAGAIAGDGFRQELLQKIHFLAFGGRARSAPSPAIKLRAEGAKRPALVAIGSSTGGPQALFRVAQALPEHLAVPLVLTQHMPGDFMPILADHITRTGGPPCVLAEDGMTLQTGRIHLAPGGHHLLVESRGSGFSARLSQSPPENFCRPSVDPMLRSAAIAADGRVLAVILTGMGQDGLEGTAKVVGAGGTAIAQDEATSVVWGMPGAVARAGLCHAVLPIGAIAAKIQALVERGRG